MRVTREEQVPITTTIVEKLTCDICGKESPKPRLGWQVGRYDITNTTIKCERGLSYPDGGSGIVVSADICPECFESKLIPWIESFGLVELSKEEWLW